jgi:hypothetical protein
MADATRTGNEVGQPEARRQTADDELQLKRDELALKREEFGLKQRELALKEKEARLRLDWRTHPIALALLAGVVAIVGNSVSAYYSARNASAVERQKAEASLILEAVKTSDRKKALDTLRFFLDVGLITDPGGKLLNAIKNRPETIPLLPLQALLSTRDDAKAWAHDNCPPATELRTQTSAAPDGSFVLSWWCEDSNGARQGPYVEFWNGDPRRVAARARYQDGKPVDWSLYWNADATFREAICAANAKRLQKESEVAVTPCRAEAKTPLTPVQSEAVISKRFAGAFCHVTGEQRFMSSCGFPDEAACRQITAKYPPEYQHLHRCEPRPPRVECFDFERSQLSGTNCYVVPEGCKSELNAFAPPDLLRKSDLCRVVALGN